MMYNLCDQIQEFGTYFPQLGAVGPVLPPQILL
jgi:hypothetical protein